MKFETNKIIIKPGKNKLKGGWKVDELGFAVRGEDKVIHYYEDAVPPIPKKKPKNIIK